MENEGEALLLLVPERLRFLSRKVKDGDGVLLDLWHPSLLGGLPASISYEGLLLVLDREVWYDVVPGGGVRLWEVEEEQLGCEYWFKKADVGERLLSLCDGLKFPRGEGEGLLEGGRSSSKSSGRSAEAPSENLEKKGFPL